MVASFSCTELGTAQLQLVSFKINSQDLGLAARAAGADLGLQLGLDLGLQPHFNPDHHEERSELVQDCKPDIVKRYYKGLFNGLKACIG